MPTIAFQDKLVVGLKAHPTEKIEYEFKKNN